MGEKKYLFFDYDGTLRSREAGGIPQSAARALDILRERGHLVALATGRQQADAIDLVRATGIKTMVADGGNSVTLDGELVWIDGMPLEPCRRLLHWLDDNGWVWAVNTANERLCYTYDSRYEVSTGTPYYRTVIDPGLDINMLDPIYKIFIACPRGEETSIEFGGVTWARYEDRQVFCEPTHKSRGIRKLMSLLDAPLDDVIVFGDGSNDLEMFEPAWTKVAMGNAIDELKERASLVTSHIDDNGIWNACKRLGLL